MDFASVVDSHTTRRVTVSLCPDGQLVDELAAAEQLLAERRRTSASLGAEGVEEAQEAVGTLRRQVDGLSTEFVLQSIGRTAWVKLRDAHQPTKSQRDQYRQYGQVLDHNPDTFPVAAIAASLVEPEGASEALVQKMWDTWNFGECERLWRACLDANMGAAEIPKSWNGSVSTPDTGPKSEPPTNSGDPEASSTAGGSLAG